MRDSQIESKSNAGDQKMSLLKTVETPSSRTALTSPHTSRVLAVPPTRAEDAVRYFAKRLGVETDCSDVNAAHISGKVDFVLLDVRHRKLFEAGHVPGAINIPVPTITEGRMAEYPPETVFVVYCAGSHCNGANKAALLLAEMGRPVKEMIGGVTGWIDEGLSLEPA